MVAVCGKTSNMQLSQNNKCMSLQAIWLDVNWSMTDPIYSVSRWLIFFCCCIWQTRNCFSNFFFFWRECLHLYYIQNIPRVVLWHNFTSKQDKQFIVLLWTAILFNRPNVNMFFLFVCLSDCKYLLFPCISDTLVGDFLYVHLIYRRKVIVPSILLFSQKRLEIIFRGSCRPRKLKSAKNNPHVFATKPDNLATRKYPIIRYVLLFAFKAL